MEDRDLSFLPAQGLTGSDCSRGSSLDQSPGSSTGHGQDQRGPALCLEARLPSPPPAGHLRFVSQGSQLSAARSHRFRLANQASNTDSLLPNCTQQGRFLSRTTLPPICAGLCSLRVLSPRRAPLERVLYEAIPHTWLMKEAYKGDPGESRQYDVSQVNWLGCGEAQGSREGASSAALCRL